MKKVQTLGNDDLAGISTEALAGDTLAVKCVGCNAEHRVSAEAKPMYCIKCGTQDVEFSQGVIGKVQGEKIMASREEKIAKLKDRIRAKHRATASAATTTVTEATRVAKQKALAKVLARRRKAAAARIADKKGVAKKDEYVSIDTILETVAAVEKKEVEASAEKRRQERRERVKAKLRQKIAARRKALAEEGEYAEEEVPAPEAPEAEAPVADEPAVDAAPEAKPEGDETFMDLDMVLSSVRKKELRAKMKRARARYLARKAKAADEAAPAAEAPKAEDLDAPAAEAPAPAKAPEAAPVEGEPVCPPSAVEGEPQAVNEPGMVAEDNPTPTPEGVQQELQAMKFEPLASVEALASVKREEIDMALFDEGGENPTWNVSVAGVPVCRVSLADQANPEDIRKVFCSENYALDIMEHCVKSGFVDTMNKVSAKFWAASYTKAKAVASIEAAAKTAADADKKKYLASFKDDFLSCVSIVTSGLNKNFFPEGNPLKDALFDAMTTAGLPDQTTVSIIEASFAAGAPQFFKTLLDKSTEYMALTPQARAEIARAITRSPVMAAETGDSELPNQSLSDRLATASVAPRLTAGGVKVRSAVEIDTDSYKHQLKGAWKPRT
jgi:ribosomal protein S27E